MINISNKLPLTIIASLLGIAAMIVAADATAGLASKTHVPEIPDTVLNIAIDVEEHIKYNLTLMGYEVGECDLAFTQTDQKDFGHVASYVFIGMATCEGSDSEGVFQISAPSTVGVEIHDDGLVRISWKPDILYFLEK